MQSRLRVQGHPIQPMLVTFPFGLFVCAAIFDLADVAGGPAFLGEVGYWTAVRAALFLLSCLIRASAPQRGATGVLLAAELVALAVGAVGVALGARLMQQFDRVRATEPTGFETFGDVPAGATVEIARPRRF